MSISFLFNKKLYFSPTAVQYFLRNMSSIVTLNLKQGSINGEEISLPSGKRYYKFFGIPYAKPPLKDLRFRSPEPLAKFPDEPLDCTKERNQSLQINLFSKEITGSEDCLYLNVHTSKIQSERKSPVMVYIHGGGFMTGSGNRHILYPKFLIEEDIVLVTINYRLGPFGFLSLPSGGISGNFGLKDQQMALKWVHDNIHKFNGDPNNVTLFGHSAGGASAHMQLLSEQSRKYFHKIICQSGLATMKWVYNEYAEEKAFKLAEILGFKGNSTETANFLRNFEDSAKMFTNMSKILVKNEQNKPLALPFHPVIETKNCEKPFITETPSDLICKTSFENIPIIMGYSSKEGIMLMAYSSKKIEDIDLNLSDILSSKFNEKNAKKCDNLTEKVREFYFNGKKIKNENVSELCDLLGDTSFVNDLYKTAKLHAQHQPQSPLYCFKFSYDGKLNNYKTRYKYEHVKGACHGDELYYLFYPNEIAEQIEPDENDLLMIKRICKLWANFAKFGNPTPPNEIDSKNVIDFTWSPTTFHANKNFEINCLDLDEDCAMKKDPDGERVKFWENLLDEKNSG